MSVRTFKPFTRSIHFGVGAFLIVNISYIFCEFKSFSLPDVVVSRKIMKNKEAIDAVVKEDIR